VKDYFNFYCCFGLKDTKVVILLYKAIVLIMCMFYPIEKVLLFVKLNLFSCMWMSLFYLKNFKLFYMKSEKKN